MNKTNFKNLVVLYPPFPQKMFSGGIEQQDFYIILGSGHFPTLCMKEFKRYFGNLPVD